MPELNYRFLEADSVDEGSRTLDFSFASETPVHLRSCRDGLVPNGSDYYEVLSCDPANVDLSALNDSGAFLDEHDPTRHLGKVLSANIDSGKCRAKVCYDTHELAETRYKQMTTRTRPHISVGYKRTSIVSKSKAQDGNPVYVFSWRAEEVSSVAIPADRNVGVGRSVDSQAISTSNKHKSITQIMPELTTADIDKARSEATAATRAEVLGRAKEITKIADEMIANHGKRNDGKLGSTLRSLTNDYLSSDKSVSEFTNRCLSEIVASKPAVDLTLAGITNGEDTKSYSLKRAMQSCLQRESKTPDGFEGEVHAEMVKRMASDNLRPSGFLVPWDTRAGTTENQLSKRDLQATVFASGGAFVPSLFQAPIIELLRNKSVLNRTGMRVMSGLTGNVIIPRQESPATAYSVSEIGALTQSFQTVGQVVMSPKRLGVTLPYSKQLVLQSSPDVEAFIRDDMFRVLALKADYLGINGIGASSEPLGVMNTPGIGAVTFSATPTYAKLVSMETAIRSANVQDPIMFVTTPTVRGALKSVAVALTGSTIISGIPNALWQGGVDDGELAAIPAIASNQIPNNQVVLGAWEHLIQGLWGGLDIVVDNFTKAANGEIVITANMWLDYVLRHPQAFVISTDNGNQ